jgi:hypothetical protein
VRGGEGVQSIVHLKRGEGWEDGWTDGVVARRSKGTGGVRVRGWRVSSPCAACAQHGEVGKEQKGEVDVKVRLTYNPDLRIGLLPSPCSHASCC